MTGAQSLELVVKFAGLALVTMWLTLLVIEGSLLNGPRGWIATWSIRHNRPKVALFFKCLQCVGFWIALGFTQLLSHLGYVSLPLPALWPFALNMVAMAALLALDRL